MRTIRIFFSIATSASYLCFTNTGCDDDNNKGAILPPDWSPKQQPILATASTSASESSRVSVSLKAPIKFDPVDPRVTIKLLKIEVSDNTYRPDFTLYVNGAWGGVGRCFIQSLEQEKPGKKAKNSGTASLMFGVTPQGSVTQARLIGGSITNDVFRKCVPPVFESLKFSNENRPPQRVTLDLDLQFDEHATVKTEGE